jgi:hypothetical protein
MASVSYQTIKLSRGKHSVPEDGACVMELASMLAGEAFTDQPASVCPVIASFLRAYNDVVDDDRRQDLYAYAAKVVGSTGSAAVQRARADRLMQWAREARGRRWNRWLSLACLDSIGFRRQPSIDVIGIHAVRSMPRLTAETHRCVLALVDELLALEADGESLSDAPRQNRTRADTTV